MTHLPYARQWVFPEDVEAVTKALESDWLTQGPAVEAFEEALASAVGARYAVAVSNGTAALHLAYLALGVGPGDVIVTSPITFVATANAALYCGARPELVDVDPSTICLDPNSLEERLAAGLRPKLVVPVHFGGLPCDMARLATLSERFGFRIVEDACHALGARYVLDGAWGPIGDCRASAAAVFSFHPVKHITTGEGGAVVTNDSEVAEHVRRLRSHGVARTGFRDPQQAKGADGELRPWYYEQQELGFNCRITDFQCALGLSQLRKLDAFVSRRGHLARRYDAKLTAMARLGRIKLPKEPSDARSAWHLYPVRIPKVRDRVYSCLRAQGIVPQVHYIPVHLQPFYRERFGTGPGQLPTAEAYFEEALSLPLYPAMAEDAVDRVSEGLCAFFEKGTL